MKSATRVLAMIALGGGVAGAAVAVTQVPAPQAATTVAVSSPDPTAAVQQLADESAQLDVAIASAKAQLAQLSGSASTVAATPSASPNLADLLSQAQSQLAIARQRLAADEALLAKLHALGQRPSAAAAPHPNGQPAPSLNTAPTDPQSAQSTPAAGTPTWQRTQSPSPRPTNRGGDD